jgi:xylose isomerase
MNDKFYRNKIDCIEKKLCAIVDNTASSSAQSNLQILETQANDLVTAFTWLDGGASDQRPDTITYSSAQLGLTVIKTFTYNGGAGTYHVATITLS